MSPDERAARALPPTRRSTIPTPAELTAVRDSMTAAAPEVTTYGDVPCVVCEPPQPGGGTLLYFHGGGYRLGSAALFAPFAARLADATGARVVAVDYRLAPENPFPAALHDAVNVYERVLAETGSPPVAIGDSAGGGLAAALAVACTRADVPVPRALVLMSAWLDLRCTAGTYTTRAATDRLFSHDAARQAAAQYLQGHDEDDPLASPLLADAAAFPPTLLFASTGEVLLDDTLTMASHLARAGVPTLTAIERDVPHTWPSIRPDLPESVAALQAIARFVKAQEAT